MKFLLFNLVFSYGVLCAGDVDLEMGLPGNNMRVEACVAQPLSVECEALVRIFSAEIRRLENHIKTVERDHNLLIVPVTACCVVSVYNAWRLCGQPTPWG
jgi:hypothetical protein